LLREIEINPDNPPVDVWSAFVPSQEAGVDKTIWMRSYFVTQCRQSGLTDADIACLIGDKSGPQIISTTYGDVRPDHLFAQAKRVRLLARKPQ
jgi:hypothetical protein